MSIGRRKPDGPGFGYAGGSNLTDYLGATARSHQIELAMEPGERLVEIPVELIDRSPYQARATFDPAEIAALAEDIRENGLNHPVTVREGAGGRYELVAGERRWLAVREVGLAHVTARVRPLDDFAAHLVGVSENNRRANLSPWEMALEASRLQEHAGETGRPHAQRDLARYLNRNVAIVNQQLAIAAAITTDLLTQTQVSPESLGQLPHVTLHRIAKLPESRRSRALKEAIRMQQPRGDTAKGEAGAALPSSAAAAAGQNADLFWEQGGFHLQIRKPLGEIDPERAERYIQQLLPGLGGLAARIADGDGADAVIRWESQRGELLFIRPPERMTEGERRSAREALQRRLDTLEAPAHPRQIDDL